MTLGTFGTYDHQSPPSDKNRADDHPGFFDGDSLAEGDEADLLAELAALDEEERALDEDEDEDEDEGTPQS